MTERYRFHAPCALGLAGVLAEELRALGAAKVRARPAAVSFEGDLAAGYRACLWSRCASRVLLEIARFPAPDAEALYRGARRVDFSAHLDVRRTFAIRATGTNRRLRHTGFAAQKLKDAIVDGFRQTCGERPSVEPRAPDLLFHLHIQGTWATVSVDFAGLPLHRRGYRVEGVEAPLKENVAAALLLLSGWPEIARQGGGFVDPMCGSGTLPIEAAWIAADVAPGLLRERFGLHGWQGHDHALWEGLVAEARARAQQGLERLPPIVGYEADRQAVGAALQAVARAGLTGHVHVERRELQRAEPPVARPRSGGAADRAADGGASPAPNAPRPEGLVAVNPPYGHRLGEVAQLRILYASLGRILRERFAGYRVAVLTPEPELAACLGLGVAETAPLRNGGLACTLYRFAASGGPGREEAAAASSGDERGPRHEQEAAGAGAEAGAEAGAGAATAPRARIAGPTPDPESSPFANRLRKRARHLGKWARREGITCYRVYDADLPEYAVAIDRYEDRVHVQEYAPPATVDPAMAALRLREVLEAVPAVLGVPPEHVFLKVRQRQRGRSQYRKVGEGGAFHEVREGGHRFLVNLEDYLDTGLFLDHRLVRARIGAMARGARFLNLFCYTGTATVYAARGGARHTTSVDRSATYLGWARRNLALNGLSERRNRLVRADARRFLAETRDSWDLIFVDPPTFSNTKAGDPPFDVQQDHAELLRAAARRLAPGGRILFSTNRRRFGLAHADLGPLEAEDISHACLPEDFRRTPRIHHVFELRLPGRRSRGS